MKKQYNKLMRCAKIVHDMSRDKSLPDEVLFNISRAETLLKIAVTDIGVLILTKPE